MKRAISLILILVMCLSLCACGNSAQNKFVGTYKRVGGMSLPTTVGYNGGNLHTNGSFDGEFTIVINKDGTGRQSFVANEYGGNADVLVYECQLTWEVVDEYLYVTGNYTNKITNKNISVNDRYRLEGKTLVQVDGSNFTYTKQ